MTDSAQENPRFGCPHCNGENISENNFLHVLLRVSEWCEDGEPASYSYPWREKELNSTGEANIPRYYCSACDQNFEEVIRLDALTAQSSGQNDSI